MVYGRTDQPSFISMARVKLVAGLLRSLRGLEERLLGEETHLEVDERGKETMTGSSDPFQNQQYTQSNRGRSRRRGKGGRGIYTGSNQGS